jgi:methylmalonyl-CoA/ethylmalonyl-CoA epimerase
MLGKIDHVAVAVSDLEAAIAFYGEVWGLQVSHRTRVEDQGVEEAMLALGESYVQLLAPTGPDTTVGKLIERRGEGLHHIAYQVDDLEAALVEPPEQHHPSRRRPGGRRCGERHSLRFE